MTSNERVEVIQADRDAAAEFLDLVGFAVTAGEVSRGGLDDRLAPIARHRLRHTPAPAADAVALDALVEEAKHLNGWLCDVARADMLEIAADGGVTVGMVVGQEAGERQKRLRRALQAVFDARAAISAYERCSGVERLREAAEALIPNNISLVNAWPDETIIPVDVTLGELRALASALSSLKESGR